MKTHLGSFASITTSAPLLLLVASLILQVVLGVEQEDYHRHDHKQQPEFVFTFDPGYAAGIQGTIQVKYDSPQSTRATLKANLDFSRVDVAGIRMTEPNCKSEPTEYEWHIHVKWSNGALTSASFAQCMKALAGNHYDPLRACGKSSQFADTPACDQHKIASYACTPARYSVNPLVCEKGDLSGKFGVLRVDQKRVVIGTWVDNHFPMVAEISPQWNIILHAVCGAATPRVACALVQRVE